MEWFNILMTRLRALLRRESVLRDIEEELRVHVEMETEMNIKRGMPPDEARAAALKSFGSLSRNTELGYDIRGGGWLESLWQDLRYGLRMMLKNLGFATIAVLTLALGIGANTAIFSLINAMMLRMLPVKDAQELAIFSTIREKGPGYNFSYPLYERFRDRNQSFNGVIAGTSIRRARLIVNESGAVESAREQHVSGNFFSMLGVGAVVGRMFTEADDNRVSAQPAAVISYEFWKRRFGLDPGVVGRKISINDTPLVIVGVAPLGFSGFEVGARPDLWRPVRASNDPDDLNYTNSAWLRVMGRLRPGANVAQAQADIEVIIQQHLGEFSFHRMKEDATRLFGNGFRLETGSGGYTLSNQFRQPLLILMTTVALVCHRYS